MSDTQPLALTELFAAREEAWSKIPACAAHYPKWCDCDTPATPLVWGNHR